MNLKKCLKLLKKEFPQLEFETKYIDKEITIYSEINVDALKDISIGVSTTIFKRKEVHIEIYFYKELSISEEMLSSLNNLNDSLLGIKAFIDAEDNNLTLEYFNGFFRNEKQAVKYIVDSMLDLSIDSVISHLKPILYEDNQIMLN